MAGDDTYGLYNESMGSGRGGITRSGSAGSYFYGTVTGRENMPVIVRNAGATFFLPSEDEWYKAAYYDALSTSFFDYPAGTDLQTVCAVPGATPNTANCGDVIADVAPVGSYTGSASPNGTFDQGGNVREWTEAIAYASVSDPTDFGRYLRGGRFNRIETRLAASFRTDDLPSVENFDTGFRMASVPEPGVGLLVVAGLMGLAEARTPLAPGPLSPSRGKRTQDRGQLGFPRAPQRVAAP